MHQSTLTVLLSAALITLPLRAAPPALPAGLNTSPSLPAGLAPSADTPSLPAGLDKTTTAKPVSTTAGHNEELEAELYGWVEYRYGKRVRNHQHLHDDEILNELRLHFDANILSGQRSLEIAFDFLADAVDSDSVDLNNGEGWFDLRKLSYYQPLSDAVDVRAGRQILTWGTGDLLFLNDLFPKDWHYMIGRDIEYIKSPSDAIKLTFYHELVNVDVVYTPQFEPDRLITGKRMSLFDPRSNSLTGSQLPIHVPDDTFDNDEINLRLSRNLYGAELALYGYHGYFHSPSEFDPVNNRFTFSRLSNIGLSFRAPLGPGIFNAEFANWTSLDDRDGNNPWIRNSERRYLLGYEWEAARELTVGLQYYVEHMQDYHHYRDNLPAGSPLLREKRELFTLRMTQFLLSQTLKTGFFTYYQPANGDYYVRPEVNYQVNDQLAVEAGMTLFGNKDDEVHANFGQLEENSQVYLMMRYNFDNLL